MGEGVDLVVLKADHQGVVGVGCVAFHAVGENFLDRLHVSVDFFALDAVLRAELDQFRGGTGVEGLRGFGNGAGVGAAVGLLVEGLGLVAVGSGVADQFGDLVCVEVDVGYRGEEAVDHEPVDGSVLGAFLTGQVGPEGDTFHRVNQEVLQRGDIRFLTADTYFGAAAVSGLFALVAKHVFHYFLLCVVFG